MVLISIVLFLGGAILLLNKRARSINIMSDFDECTHLIGALKNILVQIQKHRGLTTAFLSSNEKEYRGVIQEKKRLADEMWISLISEHPTVIEDPLYLGITDHWERLKKRWPNGSVANNIEQHNRLILNLIRLIDSQEENNVLFASLLRKQGLAPSWKTLLETVEILGQIRAIGTSAVSSGKSKISERNKMIFLAEKAEGQLIRIIESFEQSSIANSSDEIEYYLSKSKINTRMLCVLVMENFSKPTVHNLSATHFFDLATTAIESFSLLFDSVILALQAEVLSSNSWPIFLRNTTHLKAKES